MRMRLSRFILLIALVAVGCDNDPGDPANGLPADTARGAGLLLPWSELSGRITYATATELRHVDAARRMVRVIRPIGATESVVDIDASPTGTELAMLSLIDGGGSRITILNISDGVGTRFIDRGLCPRFLPDGRISYLRGDTVYVEGVRLLTLEPAVWSCPTWSADAGYFIIALREGASSSRLYRVNTITRSAAPITEAAIDGAWFDPVLLPGSARVAFIHSGAAPINQVFVSNADGGSREKIADTDLLFGLDWAPNGTQLLGISTAGAERGLFLVRVSDGAVRRLALPPVYAATWGP
jgi:hypothetical protein